MKRLFCAPGALATVAVVIVGLAAATSRAAEGMLSADQIENQLFAKSKAISPARRLSVDMPAVTFEFNSATLTPAAQSQLDVLGQVLSKPKYRGGRFIVGGHTDAVGSDNYNKGLSQRRAAAVIDYLVSRHGLAQESLTPVGYGESRLIRDRAPEDPTQRRAEIINLRRPR